MKRYMVVVGGFLVGAILFAQLANPVHRVFDPFQIESFVSIKQVFSSKGLEKVPAKAPDLKITTMEGAQVTLKELCAQNQLVVVNFWATWCRPCIEEMPDLEKIHLAYRDQKVAILGVAKDKSTSDVKEFLGQQKITYKMALDDQDEIAKGFGGIKVLPTTVFLDSQNNILKMHKGYMARKELEKHVKSLVKK